MQWTPELDSLLNQCVFETGYDFTAAAALLLTRARQLRLLTHEGITISSDECQVHWMEINPIEDEDDDPEDDDGEELHASLKVTSGVVQSAPRDAATASEVRPPLETENQERGGSTPEIPDGCPRLELPISDADLDALISALPSHSSITSDQEPTLIADFKQVAAPSEMQWVLSFLVDPVSIAHHDAEAKNLLDRPDKTEDDNYQFFLQELHQANLLSPPEPPASPVRLPDSKEGAARERMMSTNSSHDGSSSDEEEEEEESWHQSRSLIKTGDRSALSEQTPAVVERMSERSRHTMQRLRVSGREKSDHGDQENEDDDNGLDALPTIPRMNIRRQLPIHSPPAPSAKRAALTKEIEANLKKHGEFQFPKHLFRHHNAESEGAHGGPK
ncbi:hypothetical protein PINS_up018798 [Pythium insidiosum]|nr:hypothetical protein PINS_up018798 [Pythium insidiosum]